MEGSEDLHLKIALTSSVSEKQIGAVVACVSLRFPTFDLFEHEQLDILAVQLVLSGHP